MTGIPSWARIGAKVVCINTEGWGEEDGKGAPAVGPSYREVCTIDGAYYDGDQLILYLVEWPFVAPATGEPDGYSGAEFRPLVPPKTQAEDVRAIKLALREMPVTERLDRLMELLDEDERA